MNSVKISEESGIYLAVENGLDPALKAQLSTFTDSMLVLEIKGHPKTL